MQKWFAYNPGLDGLRGFSLVLVLLAHGSDARFKGGWIGVDLFFVLSGFLITSLLVSEFNQFGCIRLSNFYIRRGLRLIPPLIMCVILANLLWAHTPILALADQKVATLASLFYAANVVPKEGMGSLLHCWSLSVEEHFYLLWPLILASLLLKVSSRARIKLVLAMICAVSLFRIYVYSIGDHLELGGLVINSYFFTFCRIDAILMGSLLAFIPHPSRFVHFSKTWSNQILLGLLMIYLVILFTVSANSKHWHNGFFIVSNLLCFLTVALVSNLPTHPYLNQPSLCWLGQRSYGIYLYHFPIFLMLDQFREPHNIMSFSLFFALKCCLSILTAELSFRFIERPILSLKKRFDVFSSPEQDSPLPISSSLQPSNVNLST